MAKNLGEKYCRNCLIPCHHGLTSNRELCSTCTSDCKQCHCIELSKRPHPILLCLEFFMPLFAALSFLVLMIIVLSVLPKIL